MSVDVLLDLVAAAMSTGATPAHAVEVVAAHAGRDADVLLTAAARHRLGARWDDAWVVAGQHLHPLRDALRLSDAAGVPGAALLRAAADEERRSRHRRAEAAAQRLGVRLVLPLGLCALPAFVAWGVLPVVLSLAGDAGSP